MRQHTPFKLFFLLFMFSAASICKAGELPIIDVHSHITPSVSPQSIAKRLNKNNIKWFSMGVKGASFGGEKIREKYSRKLQGRYIALGGQSDLNAIYRKYGIEAAESAERDDFKIIVTQLDDDFENGKIKGIGEIFANNRKSSKNPDQRRKMRIDCPSIKTLYSLSSKHNGFLTLHMHWDTDSVEQLKNLIRTNPQGHIILAHAGVDATPSDLRNFFKAYPNVNCDLSARHKPKLASKFMEREIFNAKGIHPEWKELMEEFPDRFMVGTDVDDNAKYNKAIKIIRKGLLAHLSNSTAQKVAYQNAERIFDIN